MLEEMGLAAWPAQMTLLDDGWVIRLSGGHTKRANSVTVLAPSTRPVADKIAHAEGLFARHAAPSVFRLTELADVGLDRLLDRRGYRRAEESIVMVAPLCGPQTSAGSAVVTEGVAPDWVGAYARLQGLDAARAATLMRMMELIAPPHATARIVEAGIIVGFGLGVVDRGLMGVFEVLTHPSVRRRGIARQVMTALFAWGAACGARQTYLQVVATNAAAIRLYRDLGYEEAYHYWYRIGG
jgi:ribosomal protein S18 acetylase RimI-like enzyme